MIKVSVFIAISCLILSNAFAHSLTGPDHALASRSHLPGTPKQEFYALRIYQLKAKEQEGRIDNYLQHAFLPALHRIGILKVGVFKPVGNDTAAIRRVYVLLTFRTLEQYVRLSASLQKDAQYLADGKDYLDAEYTAAPYDRIENILLQAFPDAPQLLAPRTLKAPLTERFYELRSYENPTEKYFANKVQMFNQGGEVSLFKKHDCNAIFYGTVLAGAHQPNLMYMLGFDSMTARDAHWKAFGTDPITKQLFTNPEYQHNISHVDQIFLHPTEYSDL
jgi:NIPSNAP protein